MKQAKWVNLNQHLLQMIPLFKLVHVFTTGKGQDLVGSDSADSFVIK